MPRPEFWIAQPARALAARWEYLIRREGWSATAGPDWAVLGGPQARRALGVALVAHSLVEGEAGLLGRIRRNAPGVSLILTSGADIAPGTIARALEAGADDHFFEAIDDRLFLAKLKAHLRRILPSIASALAVLSSPRGDLRLDRTKAEARVKDSRGRWRPLPDLTPTEIQLLSLFLERPGAVLERRFIVESIRRDEDCDIRPGTVDKHIESLRRKLGRLGARVRSVYGVGYGFREE
jgi:DNA-binding response OmpR family regulator